MLTLFRSPTDRGAYADPDPGACNLCGYGIEDCTCPDSESWAACFDPDQPL